MVEVQKKFLYVLWGWILIFMISCESKSESSSIDELLFSCDFENMDTGALYYSGMKKIGPTVKLLCGKKEYFQYRWGKPFLPLSVKRVDSNSYLSLCIPKEMFGPFPGCQWNIFLTKAVDECWLEYTVQCKEGFDFVKGGKLPGLAGGKANGGGNVPDGTDGWSARMMFWEGGKLSFYMYHPHQETKFGDIQFWKNEQGDTISIIPGQWHTIRHHIQMNTPGKEDGVLEGWFDDALVYSNKQMCFRTISKLKIDQILFSVFLGGGDSSWASKNDEYLYFDNIKVFSLK